VRDAIRRALQEEYENASEQLENRKESPRSITQSQAIALREQQLAIAADLLDIFDFHQAEITLDINWERLR